MKRYTKFIIFSGILTILPFITSSLVGVEIINYDLYVNMLYYLKFDIFDLLPSFFIVIPPISWIGAIILGIKAQKLKRGIFSLILITLSSFFLAIYAFMFLVDLW